jgi:transposase-like protein
LQESRHSCPGPAAAIAAWRWSDEIKEQAIAESLVPGANVSVIARRIGITPLQLFDWRRKALRKGSVSVAAPLPELSLEDMKPGEAAKAHRPDDPALLRSYGSF